MSLKNIFEMVKADRWTQDGCEAVNKAREADVEDKTYQIGEISQKTGLQKTANGWRLPKGAGKSGAPKSLAGTPMKKADLNSKDPYEITHSMKPDTASEAKEMDKISAFMQEETGATLRNAIIARESFYKNTKNPTPEQQEGLAALMKIQQKLGYGKPAESKPTLSKTDGNGNKVEIKITESKGGGFYVDKYVNGKKIGSENANTKESAEAKAKSMMEKTKSKPAESQPAKKESDDEKDRREAHEATVNNTIKDILLKRKVNDYFSESSPDGSKALLREKYHLNDWEADDVYEQLRTASNMQAANEEAEERDRTERREARRANDAAPRCLTGDCKIKIKK